MLHDPNADRSQWLGRERYWSRAHHTELQLFVPWIDQRPRRNLGSPVGGTNSVSGVAQDENTAPSRQVAKGDGEPSRRIDRTAPLKREVDVCELGEGVCETGPQPFENLWPVVEPRSNFAFVVDRVIAAPKKPVIWEPPEIVELVACLNEPTQRPPANSVEPLRIHWFRDHQVVVHRHKPLAKRWKPAGVCRGRDDDLARVNVPNGSVNLYTVCCFAQRQRWSVAEDLHSARTCDAGQSPSEFERVQHHCCFSALGDTRSPPGRSNHLVEVVGLGDSVRHTVVRQLPREVAQLLCFKLARGQLGGPLDLKIAIDVVLSNEVDDATQVVAPDIV